MKAFGLIHLGVLPLLLEAMAPGYAQHGPQDLEEAQPQQGQEAQPRPQEEKRKPNRQEHAPRPAEAPPERQPTPGRPTRPDQLPRPSETRPNQQPGRPTRPDEPQRPPESRPQAPPNRPTRPDRPQRPTEANPAPQPGRPPRLGEAKLPTEKPMTPTRHQGRDPGRQAGTPQGQPPAGAPPQQGSTGYAWQHRNAWPDRRAHNWQAEHRSWQERGGYDGYLIPMARYRGSFGPGHGFRMSGYPLLMIGGFPRFQFGGLWFSILDPWPEYWSDDWYGSDDLYIEWFAGGYYLRNRRHPMDRMALTIYT